MAHSRSIPLFVRSILRSIRSILVALVLVLFTAGLALADTVQGRVLDPDGRPVAGAAVLILSGSRVVATAATNRDGRYGPLTLPAGAYDVVASATGLKSVPSRVTVTADAALTVDVTLEISAVQRIGRRLGRAGRNAAVAYDGQRHGHRSRDARSSTDRERRATRCASCPGLGVLQSGGRGALTSLFPRGGESDYTLVLVDGIEQNAFGGGFDAAHLSVGGDRPHRGRARAGERALRRRRDRRHRPGRHAAWRTADRPAVVRGRRLRDIQRHRIGRAAATTPGATAARSARSRPTATRA